MFYYVKSFFSMASALILMLIFAIASGTATIIESSESTAAAWALVYGTTWFGAVQLLLGINLAYNIFAYKLISAKKLPALLFHAGFVVILLGAIITRYWGFEGDMHIREGASSNIITTKDTELKFNALIPEGKKQSASIKLNPNAIKNNFNLRLTLPKGEAELRFDKFIPRASYAFKEAKDGEAVIELVLSKGGDKEEVYLLKGEKAIVDDVTFAFDANVSDTPKYVLFSLDNEGKFNISSSEELSEFNMLSNQRQTLSAKTPHELSKILYTVNDINFAPKTILKSAKRELESTPNGQFDAIKATLVYDNQSKEMDIFYAIGRAAHVQIDGIIFSANWGASEVTLPFSLHLKDFELARYPGSQSPMSYASDVEVQGANGDKFDYRIFMNNVLDYEGYRFFQSSYDQDEKGTILSVNKDPGKMPTYIGYFLLCLGLVLNVINPNSRFRKLSNLIDAQKGAKSAKLAAILIAACTLTHPNMLKADDVANSINAINSSTPQSLQIEPAKSFTPVISKEHAQKLSTLIIQSTDGRMKPLDTVAREILNKFHRSDSLDGMDADQALISLMSVPDYWQKQPIIAVGTSKRLKEALGISEGAKYASFDDFFIKEKNGAMEYKLNRAVEAANRKHPGSRDTFDKDVIKVDERLNVLYMVFIGEIFKAFPKPDDKNNTWYAPASAMMSFGSKEGAEVGWLIKDYFGAINNALFKDSSWSEADNALGKIKEYQRKYGAAVMPSASKLDAEMLFNRLDIFDRLTPIYLITGLILLVLVFVRILAPKLSLNLASKLVLFINSLAFLAHTAGLGLRWYISGHAPWSNAYESLVYIAWALALSGLIFSRRSPIALSLTAILAGVTLFVAHLSWLDPQITTLVPVLQSYWLTIHVSVITASYGFLGLCAMLGAFTLILLAIKGDRVNTNIERNITEATRINEMAMILGLSLLTMGNFLGGVWANESWGRYWGWDSKETWALVSILVYSIVLHIRFVPRLNNQYAFAALSMFAYWAIIMTYFGVNFYLSGMHSYAAGDPLPVPNFVYVAIAIMIILALLATRAKSAFKAKL
ncbi:cytochrome c biogenesis protein CcsA [Campylobacter sp. 19-13652]|uniref:cytochrome c biogenesis protein CcsA n=1 Tax=Campylobacter sp. 19-13652 TaxID=2840180 RepID=UPI001C75EC0C|nr:cytochrome c biogenesis protein CcsA [Campylobacter sp. 19-13652]BCX79191.1 cytochrome c biogenesis protein [Campylobacter sp. 19-13652]